MSRHTCTGKAVPVQAWISPEGSRTLKLLGFVHSRHTKVARLSALRTGCLYPPSPREYSWYSFLLKSPSRPQGHFKPATFRFITQCLNEPRPAPARRPPPTHTHTPTYSLFYRRTGHDSFIAQNPCIRGNDVTAAATRTIIKGRRTLTYRQHNATRKSSPDKISKRSHPYSDNSISLRHTLQLFSWNNEWRYSSFTLEGWHKTVTCDCVSSHQGSFKHVRKAKALTKLWNKAASSTENGSKWRPTVQIFTVTQSAC
jgi:hypothetical protein